MFKEITNEDLAKMFNIPLEEVHTVKCIANPFIDEKEYTWYKLCVFYHAITEIYDRELTDLRSPYDPTEAFIGGQERHLSNAYALLIRRFLNKLADRLGISSSRKLSDFDYYRFSAQGWINEYNRLKEKERWILFMIFLKKIFRKLFPNKEMRKYRKMHRRHTKELVKLAKETKEWDWLWLHQMVVMQIRHMHEYYFSGDNVWQVDESKNEILEQLQNVLYIQKEIEENDEDYDHPIESMNKEPELYEKFYTSIGKNILWWWD